MTTDICPTCKVRPKHLYPGGVRRGYCLECYNAHARAWNAKWRMTHPDYNTEYQRTTGREVHNRSAREWWRRNHSKGVTE